MRKRFGVAIIGGSGYGAGELLRLLALHPEIEVVSVCSRSHVGKPVTSIHSHLASICDLAFEESPSIATLQGYEKSAILLAMPSGAAIPAIKDLLAKGLPEKIAIVDLSGDLRLREETTHTQFYPEVTFSPEVRDHFTYALPELTPHSSTTSRFVSNPGCLSTAAILALAPLRDIPLVGTVVIDAKTGTSGAGREPQAAFHHPARSSDFTAYKVLVHRHEPEIRQALGERFAAADSCMFVPHLLPISRGIFVTAYATLGEGVDPSKISELFAEHYRGQPFIRLRTTPPRLVDVIGTNFCDISISTRANQVVVMSAIDNLGKGMAGQAIQNINRFFELPQERGLLVAALGPV